MAITLNYPAGAKLLIKSGQEVDFGEPFYKIEKKRKLQIDVSKKLGISPDRIFKSLKKFVGEEMKKGEIIAEKKSFLDHQKLISDFDAQLCEVNHKDGTITIDIKSEESLTKAVFFKGEVVEITKGEIKLKISNQKEFSIREITNLDEEQSGGEVYYYLPEKKDVTEEEIDNRVIVVKKITAYNQVKFEALGAIGFLVQDDLPDKTDRPVAKLKGVEDLKKIQTLQLPYCILDKKKSRIIFYQ